MRIWLAWRANRRGVAALEYALVAPLFLLLIFGIMESSRIAWARVTLEWAVARAARCGALQAPACSSLAATALYATQSAPGLPVNTSHFSVTQPACGVRVAASYPFTTVIPLGARSNFQLTAVACVPSPNIKKN